MTGGTRAGARLWSSVILIAVGVLVLAYTALAVGAGHMNADAGGMLLGFALLAIGLLALPSPLIAGAGFAIAFALYGGVSAFAAINDYDSVRSDAATVRGPFERLGLAHVPPSGLLPGLDNAFRSATQITIACGLGAVLASVATTMVFRRRRAGRHARPVDPVAVARVGKLLIGAGAVAVLIALARFGINARHSASPLQAMKSFWVGGTYFLLLASFALPGFGLVFSALVARRAPRREYLVLGIWMALFVLALVPAGQRAFLFEGVAVLLIVLDVHRLLNRRWLVIVACVGAVVLLVTQAVRNQLNEGNRLTISGITHQLSPGQLPQLMSGQVASFRWTVEEQRERSLIHVHDDGLALIAKPIPHALWPGKPQGFGATFTAVVAPNAAAAHVYFATPLATEATYDIGAAGAVLLHVLLGFVIALGAVLAVELSPLLAPIALMALGWTAFAFLRGDAVNAEWVSAGWLIPTAIALWLARRWSDHPTERLVVDALQLSPDYVGAGRTTQDIGHALTEEPPGVPIVLRCARDVGAVMLAEFPAGTTLETPVRSSRPRWRRLVYQQLIAPLRDGRGTTLLCPADQGPVWGRARVILCVHDLRRITHPQTSPRPDRLFYRLMQPPAIRHADVILTGSRFSESEIERLYRPAAPVTLVGYHPPVAGQASVGDGDYLLAVGALRAYKGLGTLIEAFSGLTDEQRGALKLVIAGTGSDELVGLRELAGRLGVADRVEFPGWVSEGLLDELYIHAVGVVQPSEFEGYGLAVAQALARGVPAVVSRIPPHYEIAGEYGALWFAPGDAADLRSVLARLVGDQSLRARLRADGPERIAEIGARDLSWGQAIAVALSDTAAQAPAPRSPVSATPAGAGSR